MRRAMTAKDRQIGELIRTQRLARGATQTELAVYLDLTFQQVQKYESGANRVPAARLAKIAEFLKVPVTFFYGQTGLKGPQSEVVALLNTPSALRVIRGFSAIKSNKVKNAVVDLIEAMGAR